MDTLYSVRRMLVLTDFSVPAWNAALYAAGLTRQLKATDFMLYHSDEWILMPPMATTPAGTGFVESPEQSPERISELKNELEKYMDPEIRIEVRTDERTLVTAVNTLVGQQHIGLVVAGVTGKSKLERVLIGSNALDLARNCVAPLLIVPFGAFFKSIKKIVFACDLKQVSQTTPFYAIKAFVKALDANLLILNVDRDGAHFDPDTINEMTDLHQLWDAQHPEYHYTDHKDTAIGIMEFAKKNKADLVITVPKIYGFFESLFHRGVTEQLAFHTDLPLLLFRENI
ncbi:universal stress protein [Pedobacter ginsengisoli]|uniref:universal stress protein n=1 Tax=Pedobacter ginsengisoli TaxID=363852 RepID=UPI002550F066|nr:universal stress protein [Pedobacter ginsengisoli]